MLQREPAPKPLVSYWPILYAYTMIYTVRQKRNQFSSVCIFLILDRNW